MINDKRGARNFDINHIYIKIRICVYIYRSFRILSCNALRDSGFSKCCKDKNERIT